MVEEEREASVVFTVDDQMMVSVTPTAETEESLETWNESEKVLEEIVKNEEKNIEEKNINEKNTEENKDITEADEGKNTEENISENEALSAENIGEEPETSDGEESEKQVKESVSEEEVSGQAVLNTYMVRPGDTLYQISILNYGTMEAISEICRMNNISEEEMIYPGQIIVLP